VFVALVEADQCVVVCFVVFLQHVIPGIAWRQLKPSHVVGELCSKVRDTRVLGCQKSVGINSTNLGTVVGLVNPKDVSAYEPWVRTTLNLMGSHWSSPCLLPLTCFPLM
jgi:hypothetical protein